MQYLAGGCGQLQKTGWDSLSAQSIDCKPFSRSTNITFLPSNLHTLTKPLDSFCAHGPEPTDTAFASDALHAGLLAGCNEYHPLSDRTAFSQTILLQKNHFNKTPRVKVGLFFTLELAHCCICSTLLLSGAAVQVKVLLKRN